MITNILLTVYVSYLYSFVLIRIFLVLYLYLIGILLVCY